MLLIPTPLPDEIARGYLGRIGQLNGLSDEAQIVTILRLFVGSDAASRREPAAATHWSTRKMAATLGVSAASVSRHWRANGLKPHVVRGFTLDRATGGTPKPTTLLAMATGNHLVIS